MNLLLLEYNFFHDEVLIPQIDWVYAQVQENKKIHLHVIMNQTIVKRRTLALSRYEDLEKDVKLTLIHKRYGRKGKPLNYLYIFKTLIYVHKHKIDTIVFNTIDMYNEDIKLLILLLPGHVKKIGILHDGSVIEKYRHLYDKIVVLSELVSHYFMPEKIDYIYTLLYKYKHRKPFINKDKLKICIPGNIENKRRDYQFIIDFVKNNKILCQKNNIKFLFLGNIHTPDGLEYKKSIYDHKLESCFELFSSFVPYDLFLEHIHTSDLIISLIHDNVKDYDEYSAYRISDSFNMAFSCNKPLLMHDNFKKHDEFNDFGFFYHNSQSLKETLEMIINNKSVLEEKITCLQNESKFDFEYQKAKYMKLLET